MAHSEESSADKDAASRSKARKMLPKKGGRKLGWAAPCPSRPPHRGAPQYRRVPGSHPALLSVHHHHHHNNNSGGGGGSSVPALPSAKARADPPPGTGLTLHPLKPGAKKELLKSGRLERSPITQQGDPSVRTLSRPDQKTTQNVNSSSHRNKQKSTHPGGPQPGRRKDGGVPPRRSSLHQPPLGELKKALCSADNVRFLKALPAVPEVLRDGEKVYAGAKFNEPPSPSVLPKPPSHWVATSGAPTWTTESK